ncbi:hypothetical protein CRE_14691 [Caenorhabditis remanei]|uniref:Uncharacterized protein n=1 Tax=Caenorhabditis remanei TaxID=31234 RepID=E3M9L5_CAERE|nr:hypothetical protein CRE_14691 [Caenorhabditis remanei]
METEDYYERSHQSPDSDNSLRTFLHYLVITEALTILLSDFMNICDKSIKKQLNSVVLPCIIVLSYAETRQGAIKQC